MSQFNPTRHKPMLPYWACLLLWLALGPLGAAPAACRRWGRACLEAGLTLGGLRMLSSALSQDYPLSLWDGPFSPGLASVLLDGSIRPWHGSMAALMFSMSMGLWISDLWRMRTWHGRKYDPLLDSTTEDQH